MKVCSVEDCYTAPLAMELCSKHYQRWKKYGDPLYVRPKRTCSVPDCNSPYLARDWCNMHYTRWKLYKDVNHEVTTEDRFWAKVDKDNLSGCWLWTANTNGKGYPRFKCSDAGDYAHRYSYILANGSIPEGREIDHTCHVRNCVNPSHLQSVTQKQNMENLSGVRTNNTSGFRGVHWSNTYGRWKGEAHDGVRKRSAGLHPKYEIHVAAFRARELRNTFQTNNLLDRV